MKRLNVTVLVDDVVQGITNLEVLGAYVYLAVNLLDQGISCPSNLAVGLLSDHFGISETKARHLVESFSDFNLDLNFMV